MLGASPTLWYSSEQTLEWQWSPGAFATVQVIGTYDEANADIAVHVAATLRTDAFRPVRMPFTMGSPPPQVTLVHSIVVWPSLAGDYSVELDFSDQSEIGSDTPTHELTIDVLPGSKVGGQYVPPPNTSVNGHPARLVAGPTFCQLLVYDVNGAEVGVAVNNSGTPGFVNKDAVIALARTISVVPVPSDPSTWLSPPVR
jgi:hypothetical protein